MVDHVTFSDDGPTRGPGKGIIFAPVAFDATCPGLWLATKPSTTRNKHSVNASHENEIRILSG